MEFVKFDLMYSGSTITVALSNIAAVEKDNQYVSKEKKSEILRALLNGEINSPVDLEEADTETIYALYLTSGDTFKISQASYFSFLELIENRTKVLV